MARLFLLHDRSWPRRRFGRRLAAAGLLLAALGFGCARNQGPELPRFPEYAPAAPFLDEFERRQEQVRLTQAYEMETRRSNQQRALEAQLEVWRRMEDLLAERRFEEALREEIRERNRLRHLEEDRNIWSGIKGGSERNRAANEEARRAHQLRASELNQDSWRRKDEYQAERMQEHDLRERIVDRERRRQYVADQGTWAGVRAEGEINRAAAEAARRNYEARGSELTQSSWSGVKTEAEIRRAAAEAARRRYEERATSRDQSVWSGVKSEQERDAATAEEIRRGIEERRQARQQAAWGGIRAVLERDLPALEAARQREEERHAQRRREAWNSVMAGTR